MKKLNIQNTIILTNTKEKIEIISFENKTEKYILYSGININDYDINNFEKMEFNENIQITPKKKFNDLKFNIINEKNKYSITFKNNPVFYLKNNKNIIINDSILKIITSNGGLFDYKINKIPENNLVKDILKKDKIINNDVKVIDLNLNNEKYDDVFKIQNNLNKQIVKDNNLTEDNKKIINENYEEVSKDSNLTEVSKEIINEIINEISKENINENYEEVSKDSNLAEVSKEIINENYEEVSKDSNLAEVFKEIINENYKEVSKNSNLTEIINEKILDNQINDIVSDIKNFKINDNIEKVNIVNDKIKSIAESINEEKKDLYNKNNELNNEVFNLQNILEDFNKLFSVVDTNSNIHPSESISINVPNKNLLSNNEKINNIHNKTFVNLQENIISNNTNININPFSNIYISNIRYQNINYKINTIKLKFTEGLNFSNLFNTKIDNENIINKYNLAFELEKNNLSYLFIFMNQKYLINKINNSIVLTNIANRNSQIIKNKEYFKINNFDYMLYNDCTLIVPITNKKIFDNIYGTSYNLFIPRGYNG